MANPNPKYPDEFTFVYDVVNFTTTYQRLFQDLEDALTEPVIFSTGVEGKIIKRTESTPGPLGFLFFVRFQKLDGTMVTVIHRNVDFYAVGRQTGDGLAYILDNRCLKQTEDCLRSHNIRFKKIEKLDDSYTSLEGFAQVRRRAMLIGAVGLDFALEAFCIPDANSDTRATAYAFLFFAQLISEPFRVGPIRKRLLNGFSEKGVLIPAHELQYEHCWKDFSYLLNSDYFEDTAHFSRYKITTINGNIDAIELSNAFPVIKQTKIYGCEPVIDIKSSYDLTINRFCASLPDNYPTDPKY